MNVLRLTVIALLTCLLTSCCGYHCGPSGTLTSYSTVSIPFVEGDWTGDLTAALVKEVSQSTVLMYQPNGGAITLNVKLLDVRDENIGFRYDRNRDGKLKDRIVPDETRISALAEVTVTETASGSLLLGPVRVSADVEFDHDYYSSGHVNVFSLGQLTDIDEAHNAVQRPLNQQLAQKIVDYLNDNW